MKFASLLRTWLPLACFALVAALPSEAQDPTQMTFSNLRSQAEEMTSAGRMAEAIPLLEELVRRIEKDEELDVDLSAPLYSLGVGHIQRYVRNNDTAALEESLKWFDRLIQDYPEASQAKDALLKKIDVLNILGRRSESVQLIKELLAGEKPVTLSRNEEIKLLRDITRLLYGGRKLDEGLPFFQRLLQRSDDLEDRALAATASFEAYIRKEKLDAAMDLLPVLATETDMRYRPRFNVALLKASDVLVEKERYLEASLLLNLARTTDEMVTFSENKIERLKNKLELQKNLRRDEETIAELEREIETAKRNLKALKKLPETLRNQLLLRRARNYAKTERDYEAFWMYYDMLRAGPSEDQAETIYYATFSKARDLEKNAIAEQVGEEYRSEFPQGEYFSDVTLSLTVLYRDTGQSTKFLDRSRAFIPANPNDSAAGTMLSLYGAHMVRNNKSDELIHRLEQWSRKNPDALYKDGLLYWEGLGHLTQQQHAQAAKLFERVLENYPGSRYTEDALLRSGIAHYYNESFGKAREALTSFRDEYPDSDSRDQAFFFLGEIAALEENPELAIERFREAIQATDDAELRDEAVFRIGDLLEAEERFEDMAAHFREYIEQHRETGRITDAVFELGIAYEKSLRPVKMLSAYRQYIDRFVDQSGRAGVDALIEAYAENYRSNKAMLEATVAFFDRLRSDATFREKIVTDRGFLFERFYNDDDLDQNLYNRLRRHPEFDKGLLDDLGPLKPVARPYREQLERYPENTPEEFFRELLDKYRSDYNRLAEARLLMGLYRLGETLEPLKAYDAAMLELATPRVLLYIADYTREDRLDFALKAWRKVIEAYPRNDATVVAHLRLADVSERQGRLQDAFDHLKAVEENFPGSPKLPGVRLRQGRILTAQGNYAKARQVYQDILRVPSWRGTTHARALYQNGLNYAAQGEHAKAHGYFERVFVGYPHFAEWAAKAYLEDARALVEMDAPKDAASTLQEALNTDRIVQQAPEETVQKIRDLLEQLS